MIPGTSCLATIVLSLRDQSHSPIEVPHNYLSAYGVNPGLLNGAKLRILWDDQLPRRGWRTQLKVSTREGKAGRLTYFRKAGHTGIEVVIGSSAAVGKASRLTLFSQANRPDLPAAVSERLALTRPRIVLGKDNLQTAP